MKRESSTAGGGGGISYSWCLAFAVEVLERKGSSIGICIGIGICIDIWGCIGIWFCICIGIGAGRGKGRGRGRGSVSWYPLLLRIGGSLVEVAGPANSPSSGGVRGCMELSVLSRCAIGGRATAAALREGPGTLTLHGG